MSNELIRMLKRAQFSKGRKKERKQASEKVG